MKLKVWHIAAIAIIIFFAVIITPVVIFFVNVFTDSNSEADLQIKCIEKSVEEEIKEKPDWILDQKCEPVKPANCEELKASLGELPYAMLDKLNTKNTEVSTREFEKEFESYDILKFMTAEEVLESGYLTEVVRSTSKPSNIKISQKGKNFLKMCGN